MTITKSGELASFYTVNKAPIKHLKVYFSPKQAGEGTPSPSNVREISRWDSIKVWKTGNNLLISELAVIYPYQKTVVHFGVADFATRETPDGSLILSPGTYTYAVSDEVNKVTEWAIVDENNTFIDHAYSGHRHRTFTVTELKKVRLYMSLAGQDVNPNWISLIREPYTLSNTTINDNQTILTDWTNNIGTVYGGYVDLVTGELVQTHAIKRVVGNEDWYMISGINDFCAYRPTLRNITFASNGYIAPTCNKLSGVAQWGTKINACTINENGNFYFGAPEELSTPEAVNNWIQSIGGFEFTYPISPITHQLTPTQLSTLIGRNNIWSNADRVEVEYDLAESNDELYRRRNILMRSAPHIETASGNIAHFETDTAAPIKSAIVSFSPIQEGSGDPSPENARAISGWSGVTTGQSTKNLIMYPLHSYAYESGTTISPLDEYTTFIAIDNGIKIKPRNSATGAYCLLGYVFSNKTYTLSWNTNFDSAYSRYRVEIRSNKEFTKPTSEYEHLFSSNWQYSFENNPYTFTANTDGWLWINFHQNTTASEFTISNIQLEEGNSKTSFEQSNIFTTNWQTAAGTIYGGYVDLATGELVRTYDEFVIGGGNNLAIAGDNYCGEQGTNVFAYISSNCDIANYTEITSSNLLCNRFEITKYGIWTTPDSNIGKATLNARTQFHMVFDNSLVGINSTDTKADRISKISAYLADNKVQVCFTMQTPARYTLSPITLRSLRGINNIWSNTNGPVEIKYWTH